MTTTSQIAALRDRLRQGELSCQELVERSLQNLDAAQHLGAVAQRVDDRARADAAEYDRTRAAQDAGRPLLGIPVAVKDMIHTREAPAMAHSRVTIPTSPGTDAPLVTRLRAAGAIILCKAACSEFACGSPDPSDPFPPTRNPWDPSRWAGGSSGGSAAGVASGQFVASIGTDTGGSIRIPAAFCGVTGLKPSRGLVPTSGIIPVARSMDHAGPIAATAADCGLILDAITGDDTAGTTPGPSYYHSACARTLDGLKVGVDTDFGVGDITADGALDLLRDAAGLIARTGADVVPVRIPQAFQLFSAAGIIMESELFAFHRATLKTQWSRYGRLTRRLISKGIFYSAADYITSSTIVDEVKDKLARIFCDIDCLVTLTCPRPATPLFDTDSFEIRMTDTRLTRGWSVIGAPAASVPIGLIPAPDSPQTLLPVGMQVIGPPGADHTVLRVAGAYQAAAAPLPQPPVHYALPGTEQ